MGISASVMRRDNLLILTLENDDAIVIGPSTNSKIVIGAPITVFEIDNLIQDLIASRDNLFKCPICGKTKPPNDTICNDCM